MSSTTQTPRYKVLMNGVALLGITEISVTQANAYSCGTFHFTKAIAPNDTYPLAWWAATGSKTMLVEIDTSIDGVSFPMMITGNVDSHTIDFLANTVTVAGRDLSAQMIDQRTVSTYRNQTSSEVAQTIASKYGLTANVTVTKTPVGRYYANDYDQTQAGDFSQAANEWDLICRLGSKEGIIPYVSGSTLYFNPPPATPPTFNVTLNRDANGNIVSNVPGMTFTRHLTAARDVVVTVRSWHSRKKETITATYRTKTKTAPTGGQAVPASKYLLTVPNLTQAQAQQLAQKQALEISQHERVATIHAPSLQQLTPQHVIQVSGTGTDYDMTYYPQRITVTISMEAGAMTEIDAKFSSPVGLYDNDTGEQIGESA